MELLVSHMRGCYGPAKQEIVRILRRLSDPQPRVEKSGVPGICVVHTTWALEVEKRGWQQHHTDEIIRRLAEGIDRKVRLKTPDKLVHVDILANTVAISVLRPGETFSIHAPSP